MKRKKERFATIAQNDNVIEKDKAAFTTIKGNWHNAHFKNEQPITLELACGRGEYTIGLARIFPEKNFIGIDIKGDRIWKGSTVARDEGLTNVAFLRAMISLLEDFFEPNEVSEIWITFPDPRLRTRDAKRRLTSPRFIEIYKRLLKEDGYVRLKTDNTPLFEYTVEKLLERNDIKDFEYSAEVYNSDLKEEVFDIKTKYEQAFAAKGETIKYLRFRFKDLSKDLQISFPIGQG